MKKHMFVDQMVKSLLSMKNWMLNKLRICNEALNEPNRLGASTILSSFLPSIEGSLPGIRNEGFLSTNELKHGIKNRKEWEGACSKAKDV